MEIVSSCISPGHWNRGTRIIHRNTFKRWQRYIRMMSIDVSECADVLAAEDITAAYIEQKVEEVYEVYGENPLRGEHVAVLYDMNGPITRTDSKELPVDDAIQTCLNTITYDSETTLFALNSGYDLQTQSYIRDERLGCPDFGLIGGHGSTYAANGTVRQTREDVSPDDIIAIEQQLYENAAEKNVKLSMQGNQSHTVGAVAVEGEQRSDAYKHPLSDPSATTDDIWEALQTTDGFDGAHENGHIAFENTSENAAALSHVLKHDYPHVGVRFSQNNGSLTMTRDPDDDPIPYKQAEGFVEDAVTDTQWQVNGNPDWTFDYVNTAADINKDAGTAALMQEAYDASDPTTYTVAMVGDNPSDIPRFPNRLFFAQEGTAAEQYCAAEDIPHVAVKHAGDYTLIMTSLLERNA